MHKLLNRLVRRHLKGEVDNRISNLLDAVSSSLQQQDNDRMLLEHALQTVSTELNEINSELVSELEQKTQYHAQLEVSLAKQNALLDASPEAILMFDKNHRLTQVNKMAKALIASFGLEISQQYEGFKLRKIVQHIENPGSLLFNLAQLKRSPEELIKGYIITKDQRHFEYYSIAEVVGGEYLGRVWWCRDITDIKGQENLLKHQAFHDPLTDLPNRSYLSDILEHVLNQAKRSQSKVGVLYIDLDEFRKVNDSVGHELGDLYLSHIANRLQHVSRDSDLVGRLSGDEFLIILTQLDDEKQVMPVIQRIINMFNQPIKISQTSFVVTCSIGVSFFPKDNEVADSLVRKADLAMGQAKKLGKNGYCFFDESLEREVMHRLSVENQLRQAIEKQQFVLHYQPKICLKKNKICGVEALVRWQPGDGRIVYPDQFISIAEDMGLIKDITQSVLKTACKKLRSWQNTPYADVSIAVNISALDFADDHFVDSVIQHVRYYNIEPALLELELTESVFLADVEQVKASIARLKQHKIKISIDDFGTGYSSFRYLQELDIDHLKIDQSFVKGVHQDQRAIAIAKSIIDIGHNLQIRVVAEGIETEDELNFLLTQGCHFGQGYYFSRPLDDVKLQQLLEDYNLKDLASNQLSTLALGQKHQHS